MKVDVVGILTFLGIRSIWFVLLIIFLLWVLFFPEKVDKVRLGFLRIFGFLGSGLRKRYHRQAVRLALNPNIKELAGFLSLPDELPEADIRYAKDVEDVRPKFHNGKVVIFVRDGQAKRGENVARAALAYANAVVFPDTRPYLNDNTNTALDMALTYRLIENDRDAFMFFTRQYVQDVCSVNAALNTIYSSILKLDESGFLPSILLHQLQLMTARLHPNHQYEPAVQQEVVGFIRFLARIANRETGERVHLQFELEYIRVGIVLLGADETLAERGFEPYMKAASRYAVGGYHGFYVLAAGRKTQLVWQFVSKIEKNGYFAGKIAKSNVQEDIATVHRDRRADMSVGYIQFKRQVGTA